MAPRRGRDARAHPRRGRAAAMRKPGAPSSRSWPRPAAISATCIEATARAPSHRIERRMARPTSARRTSSSRRTSHLLRGTIAEGLADVATGAIAEDDTQLIKFHGTYMQDDRDVRARAREEEAREGLQLHDPRCAFRAASSRPSSGWRSTTSPATYANGTLRLTTRADVPVPRRHQVEPEAHDAGDQRRAARHTRGLRRRQPQRACAAANPVSVEGARCGARARARGQRASAAARPAPITRSGSTARRSS